MYRSHHIPAAPLRPSARSSRTAPTRFLLGATLALMALGAIPAPVTAQPFALDSVGFARPSGLRGMLRDLFQFSVEPGDVNTTQGGLQLNGQGFQASVVGTNRLLIEFVESAIAGHLANLPFTSTNSSFSVQFQNGVPVVSRTDPGPIVAERARTLGKGRILTAANYTT